MRRSRRSRLPRRDAERVRLEQRWHVGACLPSGFGKLSCSRPGPFKGQTNSTGLFKDSSVSAGHADGQISLKRFEGDPRLQMETTTLKVFVDELQALPLPGRSKP